MLQFLFLIEKSRTLFIVGISKSKWSVLKLVISQLSKVSSIGGPILFIKIFSNVTFLILSNRYLSVSVPLILQL